MPGRSRSPQVKADIVTQTSIAQTLPPGLEVVTLTEADIAACVELVRSGFEEFQDRGPAIRAWFDARIVHNPWQAALPGLGVGIRDGHGLIGFRAMFAQPWWLSGQSVVVAFAAHTAVDPRFRGQGLGTQLIDASRAVAVVSGSTSAGVVTQKAYQRLRFEPIGGSDNGFFSTRASYFGSLQRRLGPRMGKPLARLFDLRLCWRDRSLGATAGHWLESMTRCDDEVDRLWVRCRTFQASCLERSSRYLNWRIFERPTHPLCLSAMRDRAGSLRALAVWTTTSYAEGIESAVLRDLMWPADEDDTVRRLLKLLVAHWRSTGITWVSLEVSSEPLAKLFRALGYTSLPSNGNRYWIHSNTPLAEPVRRQWFRSGLDGDYFDVQP